MDSKKVKPCEVCKEPMEYSRSSKKTCSSACRGAKGYVGEGGRIPKRALPKEHKWCPLCKKAVPLTEFYQGRDGRVFTYCRPCKNKDSKRRVREKRGLPEDAVLKGGTEFPVGSTRQDSHGYLLEKVGYDRTAHHRADKNGWVYQHVLVAEAKYKMKITLEYTVHHQNGLRDDNRPENLEIRHGPHGKGADVLPFALRTVEGRELAAKLLEDYGYTVSRPPV